MFIGLLLSLILKNINRLIFRVNTGSLIGTEINLFDV